MLERWRRRRGLARVQPGDGRPLRPIRWWQRVGRIRFHLHEPEGRAVAPAYTVEVRHRASLGGGETSAHLYVDRHRRASARLPAYFPIDGGVIEVAATGFGLKRCHHVPDGGPERPLTPDPRSVEGWRSVFERDHPAASRALAAVSVTVLLVGIAALLLQVAGPVSQVPTVARLIGGPRSPVDLPGWLDVGLGLAAAIASTERALRLRHGWLDRLGT